MNERDEFIRDAVLESIEDVDLIRQAKAPIEVFVQNGVVTVEGVVMAAEMHRRAVVAAASVPGVVKVIDHIYQDRKIEVAVAYQLATDPDIDALRPSLLINSYKGVVTLSGAVPDAALIERAVALASTVRGVRGVDADIHVEA